MNKLHLLHEAEKLYSIENLSPEINIIAECDCKIELEHLLKNNIQVHFQ